MLRDFQRPGRSAALSDTAMAATSHPDSTWIALNTLQHGGNAVDAAIAAAAMQCVVEPGMTGLGGDCFVLYAPEGGRPVCLNGSGPAPAGATLERLRRDETGERIDPLSAHAVTVPGAVDAWCRLHADFGSLPLDRLLEPAAAKAEHGYPVHPRVAWDWQRAADKLGRHAATRAVFLPGGKPPAAGDRHAQPALAETLRRIAQAGRDGFYTGPVAEDIVAALTGLGGTMSEDDLAGYRSAYETPIQAGYRGWDVVQAPPNGQGATALMMLKALERTPAWRDLDDPVDRIHLFAEITKQAYAHRDRLLYDPAAGPDGGAELVADFLSDRRIDDLLTRISMERAAFPTAGDIPPHRDTVYLCVVDRDGNAISFINSLFQAYGTGILAPESGVLLHCRGHGFVLAEGHPNAVAPGRRPLHTIIPGLLMRDGQAVMPFGVMGGQYQAAGHAHLLSLVLDQGFDVQAASDAPRHFAYDQGGALQLEATIDAATAEALAARGHPILPPAPIGGTQAIWIDRARGVLIGGSDHRKDGLALGL